MGRPWCERCRRPAVTCLCDHVTTRATRTRFVLLTHPKEARKTKNGTGRTVHLSLSNSEIRVGVEFGEDERINALIADPAHDCRLVYPGPSALNLSRDPFDPPAGERRLLLFLIDATWPCAKKMMKLSPNLQCLPRVSFDHTESSEFVIKQQPDSRCLSTIEATDRILSLLHQLRYERHDAADTRRLLEPFRAMIRMQLRFAADPPSGSYRRSSGYSDPAARRQSLKHSTRRIVFGG